MAGELAIGYAIVPIPINHANAGFCFQSQNRTSNRKVGSSKSSQGAPTSHSPFENDGEMIRKDPLSVGAYDPSQHRDLAVRCTTEVIAAPHDLSGYMGCLLRI